ncbi:peptidoglycan editing factor PgeF [Thaumasiovibrio sp. DFM-14]|uniref:peptidoglycan editing factor PgeF n=1 Tax=Thaumasiovibrio sp. DFM-14 TaxID=3384792 RepID=UPI0039A1C8B2
MTMIIPDWPAPVGVHALSTTRLGGHSVAPYASFNLGMHVGDSESTVARNRAELCLSLPSAPLWLNQIHSNRAVDLQQVNAVVDADASYTNRSSVVSVVMTADCLPVLFCSLDGTEVAAAHAGWRGLLDGVLENTVGLFNAPPSRIMAWLGPAIGPSAFEVGSEVRDAFIVKHAGCENAFRPRHGHEGKWLADINQLARYRLQRLGIDAVYGGDRCTYSEADHFFSYRRDGQTGRQASLIWFDTP